MQPFFNGRHAVLIKKLMEKGGRLNTARNLDCYTTHNLSLTQQYLENKERVHTAHAWIADSPIEFYTRPILVMLPIPKVERK